MQRSIFGAQRGLLVALVLGRMSATQAKAILPGNVRNAPTASECTVASTQALMNACDDEDFLAATAAYSEQYRALENQLPVAQRDRLMRDGAQRIACCCSHVAIADRGAAAMGVRSDAAPRAVTAQGEIAGIQGDDKIADCGGAFSVAGWPSRRPESQTLPMAQHGRPIVCGDRLLWSPTTCRKRKPDSWRNGSIRSS